MSPGAVVGPENIAVAPSGPAAIARLMLDHAGACARALHAPDITVSQARELTQTVESALKAEAYARQRAEEQDPSEELEAGRRLVGEIVHAAGEVRGGLESMAARFEASATPVAVRNAALLKGMAEKLPTAPAPVDAGEVFAGEGADRG